MTMIATIMSRHKRNSLHKHCFECIKINSQRLKMSKNIWMKMEKRRVEEKGDKRIDIGPNFNHLLLLNG